jgi:hypothetical protein
MLACSDKRLTLNERENRTRWSIDTRSREVKVHATSNVTCDWLGDLKDSHFVVCTGRCLPNVA